MIHGSARAHTHEPIVPAKDGRPPGFVVSCLDCGWAHDAHGDTGPDAIASVSSQHEPGHRLTARSVDYSARGRTTGPHPLYA